MAIKITGTGSYIPSTVAPNKSFEDHTFYGADGSPFPSENTVIIEKFEAITGIGERRYIRDGISNSDIAFYASEKAIADANINREDIDYIIVAHNYGDVKHGFQQSDTVPSVGSRVKHLLRIKKPGCVAYDILFGCPGWVEGMVQAWAYITSGMAKTCLVVGAEALSRVVDPHDRDSMIYSDGAGAAIVQKVAGAPGGILAHHSATFAYDEAHFIYFGESYNKQHNSARRYIKMHGRKIYEFAITNVPAALKECLEKSGRDISEIKKVLIHQANEKMDAAIVKRFYRLYKMQVPEGTMPMSISKLGNSSVATVPTLYDLILKGNMKNHELKKGDLIMFASVGAGMNINAIVYEV
ncbi:MAG: 3-oxoacyl-ACP synthase III family protein [Marinirhabdus sp.]